MEIPELTQEQIKFIVNRYNREYKATKNYSNKDYQKAFYEKNKSNPEFMETKRQLSKENAIKKKGIIKAPEEIIPETK
tara:strand:+ start:300 stop:533 length:234 start_codon:yes stop_codon:yes gene_type:complete